MEEKLGFGELIIWKKLNFYNKRNLTKINFLCEFFLIENKNRKIRKFSLEKKCKITKLQQIMVREKIDLATNTSFVSKKL